MLAYLEKYYRLPSQQTHWFTYDNFKRHLQDLDTTSTPGIPYMREAPTIGQWLKADGLGNFDEVQVARLWFDVQQLFAGNWYHEFRVFVKDEPHKISKVREGRWRLIMCASLANQMLWRMALAHQNTWLNENPYNCPSSHGLVFCYGGWRRFKAHCHTKQLRYSRDISSWDVNAPGWVFKLIREFRKRAGGPDDWLNTIDLLYEDAFERANLRFSNGVLLRQEYAGTMKSGLFVTIADNSIAMVLMHVLASLRSGQIVGSVWATGDDVLQSHYSDAYEAALEGCGCIVKEAAAELTFMGTNFDTVPKPMYFQKHVANYWLTSEFEAERLDSYCRFYAHSDEFYPFWEMLARLSGVTVRSRSYYRFWYDNPIARILNFM